MFYFRGFLIPLLLKLSIGITIGEERLVLEHLFYFFSGGHRGVFGRINGELNEFFEDVFHRLVGGMHHVLFIETVVAKLVEKDFVGGKIVGVVKILADLIHRQQQSRFAQLVFVETVLQMAQRRDGKDELLVGNRSQHV